MNYPQLRQLAIGLTLVTFSLFGCGSPPSATPTPQPPPAKSAAVEPAAAMLATAASPLSSRATPGPFDPLFESVPRTVDAVDVQDETAYLNVGPILATLDVSDRRTPHLLGAAKLPVETITGITTSDGYAYVATESGLWIVDVSNPAHPLEVGAYVPPLITDDKNPQGITGVEVGQAAGQVYAYVAAQDAGLRVVNVSNPTRPVEVGAFVPTEGGVGDVVIANNQAYLVNNEGVQIVDISDPTRLQVGSFLPIPYLDYSGVVNAIAIPTDQAGSPYIYAAAGSCQNWGNDRFCGGMLRVIDVAQPTGPQISLPFGFSGVSTNIAVSHQHAYLLTSDGLRVVDVSDPTHPQDKAFLPRHWAKDITVAEDTLYVALEICPGQCVRGGSRDGSLHIFDLSNPASPALVSLWQPPGRATVNPIEEPTVEPGEETILVAPGQTPNVDDQRNTPAVPGWNLYMNEDYGFAFSYPQDVPIKVPEKGLGGAGVSPIEVYTSADNPFHIYVKTDYLPGDVTYFLDTAPSGQQAFGDYLWQSYELPQGYADATTVSPPIFALQMEVGNVLYAMVFYDQVTTTPLQAQILSTFRILAGTPLATTVAGLTNLPAVTPVQTDLEMLVIQQVASAVCPVNNPGGEPTFAVNGTVYSFGCPVAAGHTIGARITRFPGQTEAQVAFKQNHDLSQEFHGCPAFEEQFDERTEPNQLPMRHRNHSWQVDRWLVEVSAFDDTGLALVGVLTVSEQIYQAAIAHGLITGC